VLDIYLDLDGVCVAFVEGLCERLGMENQLEKWPHGIYDLHEATDITYEAALDVYMNANFWADLLPYPWMGELIGLCQQFGNVSFASTPAGGHALPRSSWGKMRWARTHAPEVTVHLTDRKESLSRPGAVLIDDYDKNVDDFIEHGKGGYGVLFPQKWNSLFALKTWEQKRQWITRRLSHFAEVHNG